MRLSAAGHVTRAASSAAILRYDRLQQLIELGRIGSMPPISHAALSPASVRDS